MALINRYITVGGHILGLPLLLAILTLILVSVVTLLVFFLGFSLKQPSFLKLFLPSAGLVLLCSVLGGLLVVHDSLMLDHSPKPVDNTQKNLAVDTKPISSNKKQPLKFRYSLSQPLTNLGFIRNVYDDGNKTYFVLNSLKAPTVFVENGNGELEDQKDHITIEPMPDHPFPVLIVDQLATVWYLQFNNLVSHITQTPVFRRSYDGKSIKVFYSDRLFTSLDILKDSFICDQLLPQDVEGSVPRARHYVVFDEIRYYLDSCFYDHSSRKKEGRP